MRYLPQIPFECALCVTRARACRHIHVPQKCRATIATLVTSNCHESFTQLELRLSRRKKAWYMQIILRRGWRSNHSAKGTCTLELGCELQKQVGGTKATAICTSRRATDSTADRVVSINKWNCLSLIQYVHETQLKTLKLEFWNFTTNKQKKKSLYFAPTNCATKHL